jgi:hypothetical protein
MYAVVFGTLSPDWQSFPIINDLPNHFANDIPGDSKSYSEYSEFINKFSKSRVSSGIIAMNEDLQRKIEEFNDGLLSFFLKEKPSSENYFICFGNGVSNFRVSLSNLDSSYNKDMSYSLYEHVMEVMMQNNSAHNNSARSISCVFKA